MREHFEVINHKEAIDYVEAIVQGQETLSEWQIKSLHNLVLKNIDDRNAGKYRQENVVIAGAEREPPDFLSIPSAMVDLLAGYENKLNQCIHWSLPLGSTWILSASNPLLMAMVAHPDY